MFDHIHTGVASASTFMCLPCFCLLCEIRKYEVRVNVPGYNGRKWVSSKLTLRAHAHSHYGDLTGQTTDCWRGKQATRLGNTVFIQGVFCGVPGHGSFMA